MKHINKETSVSDVILGVLKKWRSILAVMLVFGALMSLPRYFREKDRLQVPLETVIENMSESDKKQVEQVRAMKKQVQAMEDYIEASPLMTMNPYELFVANASFMVEVNEEGFEEDNFLDIVSALKKQLKNIQWQQDALDSIGSELDVNYFKELIKVSVEGHSVDVSICFPNQEYLKTIAEAMIEAVYECSDSLNENGLVHKLHLTDGSIQLGRIDSALKDYQESKQKSLKTLKAELLEAEKSLTADQTSVYYGQLMTDREIEAGTPLDGPAKAGLDVKRAVMGAVLGAVLYAGVLFFTFLFSNRLRRLDSVQELLSVSFLGFVPEEKKCCFIDRLIRKHELKGVCIGGSDKQLQLIVSKLAFFCRSNNLTNLYISAESADSKAGAQICDMLREKGISCTVGTNLEADVAVLDAMDAKDGIVLLATVDVTRYHALLSQIELYNTRNIKLAGLAAEI